MPCLPQLVLVLSFAAAPAVPQTPSWWGWQPARDVAPPAVRDGSWCRNPIDRFVLARLEAAALRPAPEADRVTLIRRATYDLVGLPPSPEEVDAFVADRRPDAWERLIERLLASPQYGVKWGRHWLDLVRFAETDSYERDRKKPAAWRYRDYVIDAFNRDKPYDRFLVEQLAGDELAAATLETVVATGYYRLGIWDDEPADPLQAVYDDYDSILDTTARVVLGVSLGCARCHDHKKDPIPQRDYYRMLAFFEGVKPYKVGGGNATAIANYVKRVPADLGRDDFANRLESWRRQRAELLDEARNLADEATSRMSRDERSRLAAGRERGLVRHLTFDGCIDPYASRRDVETVPGRAGMAAGFHRRGAEIRIERPVQDDFTIAFWFRAERPGRGGDRDLRWFRGTGLVDGEVPGLVDDFGVSLIGGHVTAGTGRPERFLSSPGGLADNEWHHVAFTRDRSAGRIALWVDGVRVDEKRNAGKQSLTTPEHLTVGRMRSGRGTLLGAIDDVRFYDRVLGGPEILELALDGGFDAAMARAVHARVGTPEGERFEAAVAGLGELARPRRDMVQVLCVQEASTEIAPSFVRRRGNVHAEGEPVVAGFPAILGGGDAEIVAPKDGRSSGRRTALARWITDEANPMTARVMANRLWQHHFGRGLVRTPNDFGRLGEKPTHPELLDWLARQFVARGWSLKAMHRLIMTSSAYRMSSAHDDGATAKDPANDLFWRFEMRRLTAEEIRDSILAVTGELNPKLGGPSIYPPMPREMLETASRPDQAWGRSPPEEAARRTMFIHVKRSLLAPLLTAFDMADTDRTCAVRFVTTQPTQALTMLNSDFVQKRAAKLATRLRGSAGDDRDRVATGLRLVTQREPDRVDVEDGLSLLAQLRADEGLTDEDAWHKYCLVLLNLNELFYLD